jgi:hypothetical protein
MTPEEFGMLLHSKKLSSLYPEQLWLNHLEELEQSGKFNEPAAQPHHFCKPQNTVYKLRALQAHQDEETQKPNAISQVLIFLHLRKAA